MNTREWYTPNPYKADGDMRRVGVEVEMGGLSLKEVTEISARWAGTGVHMDNVAEGHVDTPWGKLATEVDWNYLKKAAGEDGLEPSKAKWLSILETVVNTVVPTEIAFPPIPLDELHRIEPLIEELRKAGAKGTGRSPLAAYGIHLNPELPNLEPGTLVGFIQAFGLLQWWLVHAYHVDITRRVSPYIDLYPEAYVISTLSYDQNTTFEQMREDYLHHNASRNRALDLWPLFAHFDHEWVEEHLDDEKIKARPTLHFRLPNCEIDEVGWQVVSTWQPWRAVECLAHDGDLRAKLMAEFVERQRPLLGAKRVDWVEYLEQWLKDHSLA